jgi:hypothetical protein
LQTVNYGSAGICSLIFFTHFGEKTPAGNHRETYYLDHPVMAKDFHEFLKIVQNQFSFTGNFTTSFPNNSGIMAAVLTTQPVALGYFRELTKLVPGMIEFEVKEYAKYKHGISYFLAEPRKMYDAVTAELDRLKKLGGK